MAVVVEVKHAERNGYVLFIEYGIIINSCLDKFLEVDEAIFIKVTLLDDVLHELSSPLLFPLVHMIHYTLLEAATEYSVKVFPEFIRRQKSIFVFVKTCESFLQGR